MKFGHCPNGGKGRFINEDIVLFFDGGDEIDDINRLGGQVMQDMVAAFHLPDAKLQADDAGYFFKGDGWQVGHSGSLAHEPAGFISD